MSVSNLRSPALGTAGTVGIPVSDLRSPAHRAVVGSVDYVCVMGLAGWNHLVVYG